MRIRYLVAGLTLLIVGLATLPVAPAKANEPTPQGEHWVDVGPTGFKTRRLVMASACAQACPWGELGDFVRDAMKSEGFDIILCRNCNRAEGPRLVAKASLPPPLVEDDLTHGMTERIKAPIDFGVTESSMLRWAYRGELLYARDGPYPDLRLIARIEDPTYLLVAVKPELGIHSLAEIRERKLPVRIITDFQPSAMPVLTYYGLDKASLESWGGALIGPGNITADTPFDVIVSSLASPANNPESAFWTTLTVTHKLNFLDLPDDLISKLVKEADMVRVTAPWGILRGVDRPIATAGRSGESVFTRADMPDEIAYQLARAIDRSRGQLKWYARPYALDPLTVCDGHGVPLHPGAARYYKAMNYCH